MEQIKFSYIGAFCKIKHADELFKNAESCKRYDFKALGGYISLCICQQKNESEIYVFGWTEYSTGATDFFLKKSKKCAGN